jgi:hypothetical protein
MLVFGRKRKNTKWREYERKVLKGMLGLEREGGREREGAEGAEREIKVTGTLRKLFNL